MLHLTSECVVPDDDGTEIAFPDPELANKLNKFSYNAILVVSSDGQDGLLRFGGELLVSLSNF